MWARRNRGDATRRSTHDSATVDRKRQHKGWGGALQGVAAVRPAHGSTGPSDMPAAGAFIQARQKSRERITSQDARPPFRRGPAIPGVSSGSPVRRRSAKPGSTSRSPGRTKRYSSAGGAERHSGALAQEAIVRRLLAYRAIPDARRLARVRTGRPTSRGLRRSSKRASRRSTGPHRCVPASAAPPSDSTATVRPETAWKAPGVALRSGCIGKLLCLHSGPCRRTLHRRRNPGAPNEYGESRSG